MKIYNIIATLAATFALSILPVSSKSAIQPRTNGRIRTLGCEVGPGPQDYDGDGLRFRFGNSDITRDTTIFHSGLSSIKHNTGQKVSTTNPTNECFTRVTWTEQSAPVMGVTKYFFRAYMLFSGVPIKDVCIMNYQEGTTGAFRMFLKTNGHFGFFKSESGTPTQIGADSVDVMVPNQWYRVEMSVQLRSGSNTDIGEGMVDGVVLGSTTTANISSSWSSKWLDIGWYDNGPGVPFLCAYVDDIAVNDNTGTVQNNYPGPGNIVLLKPVSDNTVGANWTDGDGVGTLFGSLDNIPPNGKAIPADGTQIKNITGGSSNYDANLEILQNVGVLPTDILTVAQGFCKHVEAVDAGSKTGAVALISNPIGVGENTFIFGNDNGKMTDWSYVLSTWVSSWTNAEVNPSMGLGVSPVMRVGKRTTGSVDFCSMGIYVEYTR